MKEFKDKVALITGAGNGFGHEFTVEACKRGMKLFLVDIDEADLLRTEREIKGMGGNVKTCVADVSLEDDVERFVNEAMGVYGQIDLLINNAGIAIPGSILDLPSRDWEWIIHVNDLSQVYAMKRVIPTMKKQGTPCHIVNVASLAGLVTMNWMPAYFATKHFAVALSESVYNDLQSEKANIQMSVFCPSFVQTDLHHCDRHRPARYQEPDDPYYKSETYKNVLKQGEILITTGTELAPVGPFVFNAIEKGQFYIELHPEGKILIKHRAKNILKERVPNYQFIKDILKMMTGGGRDIKTILEILRLK
jgi:short-subunit dehydrogenase